MDCKICSAKLIEPLGYGTNGIMIVGDAPNEYDVREGVPLSGTPFNILQQEMSAVGLHLASSHLTNLWRHSHPSYSKAGHREAHLAHLLKKMVSADAVLLIGTEVTKVLFPVTNTTSLIGLELESPLMKGKKMMVIPSPKVVMYGTVGEFRLGLKKFAEMIK